MGKFSQGEFIPKNPQKIASTAKIIFRSSWEHYFMTFLDSDPRVIQWASEPFHISYVNPLTGKNSQYIPDFLVMYMDKNGKKHAELIEIKPKKEAILEQAKSRRDRGVQLINFAKWAAAMAFCKKHSITFRVLTEDNLWSSKGRK